MVMEIDSSNPNGEDGVNKINGHDHDSDRRHMAIIEPHSELPKPEAPAGLFALPPSPSSSPPSGNYSFKFGKFIRERSNNFSAAIVKKLNSLDDARAEAEPEPAASTVIKPDEVTQFNISGLKVVVKLKSHGEEGEEKIKGRISFFSRSNCRDCTAVRRFFKQRGLKFVEINVDVFPPREKELIRRTGSSQVPQVFLNDKLFGGLVALNSLRNSGTFDERFREMLGRKCSGDAPAPPLYGFDDDDVEEESMDEMLLSVKLLRQRLPIQDRLIKLKIVKNCFSGSEMVDVLIHHFKCDRMKAVEIGKLLSRKHFIHHVFGENEFEDGNHFYRFLEHEPYIKKCYNFRVATNDTAPKPAVFVGQRLNKIMSAILEAYASDDRRHVDYAAISKSEEFRSAKLVCYLLAIGECRYVNLASDLQRVNLFELSPDEKLAFFLNLYNAMVIHAIIRVGHPEGVIDRKSFFSDFQYVVGGYPYSLSTIKNGILRNNRRDTYSLAKPFGSGDKRLELCPLKVNPLIHFGLCNGTRSSPTVRFFSAQGVEAELRSATREFFQSGGMEVNLEKRTVFLTRIIKWFNVDFGQEKEILKWSINYLDATKAGLLTHLLDDGGPVNIIYQSYDWSMNS
ncbi:F26K24.21 protein [Citrus sinensis]|uniref:F26K24.21 protein n=1 Tax=Citrus sinensis TaxID=2711 RepID=A0ACB8INW8_CITSI|nr:F26K24.21 protein [Citrus sinensis]